MKDSLKRPLAILLIIAIAIAIGFAVDRIWLGIERWTHPTDYREIIETYAEQYNVPAYLVAAIIKVESDYDPEALSNRNSDNDNIKARGLMQIIPPTFEWLTGPAHLNEGLSVTSLYDPEINIRYGTYYLHYLQAKFHNWETVIAAYNGGEGNVSKWLKDRQYSDEDGNLKLDQLPDTFKETKQYVPKVKAAMEIYQKEYQ